MSKTITSFALVCVVGCAVPSLGHAQAWIGEMAGQMAAQAAAAEREKKCVAGEPAPAGEISEATLESAELLDAYFALTSKSKTRDVGRVFALKDDGVSWRSGDREVPVPELGAILDEARPTLEPVSFIVGGDGRTARGIWRASSSADTGEPQVYAVDFAGGPKWRIWHMVLLPASLEPEPPAAYCHYNPDQAW